ncbi:MAG: DNA polymerase IV [Chloroflexi bacterium]|nr:DNA polymerase IV [Chloroflexota bacterium]MCH8817835.1 DNA polymerase IV [Chloroflexota bacterium]
MAADRTVFHVDIDAFFAAAERSVDPDLIGVPLIIGGTGGRGVVACASYEVRPYGIRSAMPMSRALRLCPNAVVIGGNHDLYRKLSGEFMAILRNYTPDVQVMSVDEAYMDMTGTEKLHGPAEKVASDIKERVRRELKLTASIGIAPSRLVAKIASAERKPDGMFTVPPGDEASYLAPMPVRKLPGIGPRAAEKLGRLGIQTLGQLATFKEGPLRREMGNQSLRLIERANGIDNSEVATDGEAKSISAETTFPEDSTDRVFLDKTIANLAEKVGRRLRRAGKHARSVTLKLRYDDFTTLTRHNTPPVSFDGDARIVEVATALLDATLRQRNAPVRLLGVGVENLTEPASQLSLLDSSVATDSALSSTLDRIRDRFGEDAVSRGPG